MNDTEKKAIEEMAKFMFEKSNSANVEPVFTTNEGQEIVLGHDLTKLLNDVLEQAFIPFLAQALYNAGYRKQSEGEWLVKWRSTFPQYEPSEYECSICGYKRTVLHNYCPNCGANMKGV